MIDFSPIDGSLTFPFSTYYAVPEAPHINVSRTTVRSLDGREPVTIRVGQPLSVLSGTKVSIECPVSGVPVPSVTWSRQDGRVIAYGSLLFINSVTTGDSGVYRCKALNLAGEDVARSTVNVTGK